MPVLIQAVAAAASAATSGRHLKKMRLLRGGHRPFFPPLPPGKRDERLLRASL